MGFVAGTANADASSGGRGTANADARSSRASSGTPLQKEHAEFGVWATKTIGTATSDVMSHEDGSAYITRWDGTSSWYYDQGLNEYPQYLKYWDLAADHYLFSAYVPYYYNSYYTHKLYPAITHTDQGVKIPSVAGNIAITNQPYWMVATTYRQKTDENSTATSDKDKIMVTDYDLYDNPNKDKDEALATGSLTDDVSLVFHPILSVVEFRLVNTGGTTMLISAQINIGDDGIYTLGDFEGRAYATQSEPANTMLDRTYETELTQGQYDTSEKALSLAELYELPQGLENKKFTVIFNLSNDQVLKKTLDIPDNSQWIGGNKYIYTFKINAGSSDENSIILMNIEVEAFKYGNTIKTDDVTNW